MRDYDLVISLGGNCATAANLQRRKLRPFSLPFDWVYFVDEVAIVNLASGIKDHFSQMMQKENLVEVLPGHPEYAGLHPGYIRYIDKGSGYRFANHFRERISCEGEYDRAYCLWRKRVERLFRVLASKQRFLLVLATTVPIRECVARALQMSFREAFPGKVFDLELLLFCCDEDTICDLRDGLVVHRSKRDFNDYDYHQTNYEWHFLDDVRVSIKPKRNRCSFHLLPHLRVEFSWNRTQRGVM